MSLQIIGGKFLGREQIEKFSNGVRLVMLVQRSKEGGTNDPDRSAKKIITRNSEEFFEAIETLKIEKKKSDLTLRIYSSVNARDLQKAIREFKMRQLEADYYDPKSRDDFYFDIKNRWVSCLMKPSCRLDTHFLIDIDDKALFDNALQLLGMKGIKIVAMYDTKNGTHIITEPFNPSEWDPELGEIKKDGLMLIDY